MSIRDGPLFFPGGYRDFQEAGNFFLPSTERLQIFSSTLCADIFFFNSPNFLITRGVSADNLFSDAPLVQRIYFSSFSHADNFFPNRYTPRGELMVRPLATRGYLDLFHTGTCRLGAQTNPV